MKFLCYSNYTGIIRIELLAGSIGKEFYGKFIVRCFSGIGQCIIARIQRRIQNPVKSLIRTFLQNYLTIFSHYLLLRKTVWCLTEFWIHLWNMPVLLILFRISSLQRYGLKTFTEDLNEYQGLEKLVYCWIIWRDCASIFIIFKNDWDLGFFRTCFNFQC